MRVIISVFNAVTGSVRVLLRANRIVSGKIDRLEKADPASKYRDDGRSQLPEAFLMRHLEEELARREVIEGKAKTNVLGITLAFSAMFAGVALISSNSTISGSCVDWWVWLLLGLLLIGGLFLLTGGALALSALRIAKIYTWTPEDEVKHTAPEARAVRVLWYLELNQEVTRLKTNQVDASYSCIRNGVMALAGAAIVMGLFRL
ncbi:MAG: phage holin family protein [Chloroflexota bacterium]|nr:phage holin family protein [Chloroflexota bacterium]MDE2941584.1 phage holin family protein [Chloroflexota bacterium]MDE3268065.1 phage holin family protein [Chloroflexota bacterium]